MPSTNCFVRCIMGLIGFFAFLSTIQAASQTLAAPVVWPPFSRDPQTIRYLALDTPPLGGTALPSSECTLWDGLGYDLPAVGQWPSVCQ
ncbi:exported hypothetical protein [Gammaproteobacteria bacterium]